MGTKEFIVVSLGFIEGVASKEILMKPVNSNFIMSPDTIMFIKKDGKQIYFLEYILFDVLDANIILILLK